MASTTLPRRSFHVTCVVLAVDESVIDIEYVVNLDELQKEKVDRLRNGMA